MVFPNLNITENKIKYKSSDQEEKFSCPSHKNITDAIPIITHHMPALESH